MPLKSEEWFKQADYDINTAEYLFSGRKYIYSVFFCHLALEKAIKGLYQKRLDKTPPKVHNLIFLIEKIGLELPEDLFQWVFTLNRASIPTRYPEDLKKMNKEYRKESTHKIIQKSEEILKWLKKQLKEQ